MTVYPASGYNSYVSVADANTIASTLVTNNFLSLTNTQKENYLIQSTLLIRYKIDEALIEDVTALEQATVILANYSVGKDMIANSDAHNIKRLKIDGALEKEWFSKNQKTSDFPEIVKELLREYGYKSSSNTVEVIR